MKYNKEFKIGAFVLIVMIVSFFTINYLRGKDIFDREIEVTARYAELDGLVTSAPVFIKGYKAGKVTDIEYDGIAGDFKVTCSVTREFAIPEDSRLVIYGVDIMGGKGIRVDLGTSDIMVQDKGCLESASEPALLDGLAGSVTPLLESAARTLDSLDVTVSGVNRLLSDTNQRNITSTLEHIDGILDDLSSVSSVIKGRSSELDTFIRDLSELSGRLIVLTESADSVMTGVKSVAGSLSDSDIAGVVTSMKRLLDSINDPNGTVGKLLSDGSVYENVDDLLNDIDVLVRKIQENPKKYLKISVF